MDKFICKKCGGSDIVPCERADSSELEYICNNCDEVYYFDEIGGG
jgi:predicted RNA-binding Zn-ribbon protein involved in translation (DUF1610 family)